MVSSKEPENRNETGSTEIDSVGELLKRVSAGRQASGEAYTLLKAQLKEIAQRQMTAADDLSVEASHVVNAVYVKLSGDPEISWKDRETQSVKTRGWTDCKRCHQFGRAKIPSIRSSRDCRQK